MAAGREGVNGQEVRARSNLEPVPEGCVVAAR